MSEWTISRLFIGAAAESVNAISMENAQGYAAITGDNNPLHFDTEEAYGMILAGFVSGVIGSQMPGRGCIYESQTMRFLRPVFYGETITTRVTVRELYPERNRVVLATECYNEQGQAVMSGEAVVLPRKEV